MRGWIFVSALLCAFAGPAIAGPAVSLEPEARSPVATTTPAQTLTVEELEGASGGQGVSIDVLTRQQLSGTTTGNTVNAGTLTSGDVTFGADALDGFSGVGNFVINTGANNTLQGAINISIVTTPGP